MAARMRTPVNQRLRQARERRCWSQEQLAELVGTTRLTVGRWEQGLTFPRPYYRQQLCEVFAVSPEDLGLDAHQLARAEGAAKSPHSSPPLTPPHHEPPPSRRPPYRAPEPPPLTLGNGLIGREEELQELKRRLCANRHPRPLVLTGLPGVGKTTLAAELAHDHEILARFPDGVLWAGLGPTPDLLSVLAGWGTMVAIGLNQMLWLTDVDAWVKALRRQFAMRRMLLIVDDAWSIEEALAFKVGGPGCAHVLTTRFPLLARQFLEDGVIPVHELCEDAGQALLVRLAPQLSAQAPDAARQLVHLAGGLPLAITLMGKYLHAEAYSQQPRRVHAACQRMLQTPDRLHVEMPCAAAERPLGLPAGTPLSLAAAIQMSTQRLDDASLEALQALSIFPPKPNSFCEAAALAVGATTPNILDRLTDAGLLETCGPERYTLHHTIADFGQLQVADERSSERLVAFFAAYLDAHATDYAGLAREAANISLALQVACDRGMTDTLVHGVSTVVTSRKRASHTPSPMPTSLVPNR